MPTWRRTTEAREFREVGGEVVLIHSGRLLSANAVGTRIWDLLEQPRSEEDLIELLANEWPGVPLRHDVREYVAQLAEYRLIAPV